MVRYPYDSILEEHRYTLTREERIALKSAPKCPLCLAERGIDNEYEVAHCKTCRRDTFEDKLPGFYESQIIRAKYPFAHLNAPSSWVPRSQRN